MDLHAAAEAWRRIDCSIIAATQDGDRLASAAAFRPVGARPVDLFSLPILCAQAEVAAVLGDLALLEDALDPLRACTKQGCDGVWDGRCSSHG